MVDERYKNLLDRTSCVQVGFYLDNWIRNPFLGPQRVSEWAAGVSLRCAAARNDGKMTG